jgi:quercetin dioxygenase-like cupin family protein
MISVLDGSGIFAGEDQEVRYAKGAVIVYEPNELHGMSADTEELLLLATIAPRPGTPKQ